VPIPENISQQLAGHILSAGDEARLIAPITDERADFSLAEAYTVAAAITELRIARGERIVGWKIGFTNRTIWDEYGVRAPIWGPMYSSTVAEIDPEASETCSLAGLAEPRIEPEIAFRLCAAPSPGMNERDLLGCIDGVAHGFEIVQSVFPVWRFKAADTVAAFALHGRYRHGPFVTVAPGDHARWLEALASFAIALFRDDVEVDRGAAQNVMGTGPLAALRHFIRGMTEFSPDWRVQSGDIVTTGTVTRAFPIVPGECWSTEVVGLPLAGMNLSLV
jgi:2-oxo-3-hexenedioate decarboxylase